MWSEEQRAFAVKSFCDSYILAQREFRSHFAIDVMLSTLKKKGGSVKTVSTPENIATVKEAFL